MKYFGYKLVMISTMDGIPVAYELVPASTDERVAADELLDQFLTVTFMVTKDLSVKIGKTAIYNSMATGSGRPNAPIKHFKTPNCLTVAQFYP